MRTINFLKSVVFSTLCLHLCQSGYSEVTPRITPLAQGGFAIEHKWGPGAEIDYSLHVLSEDSFSPKKVELEFLEPASLWGPLPGSTLSHMILRLYQDGEVAGAPKLLELRGSVLTAHAAHPPLPIGQPLYFDSESSAIVSVENAHFLQFHELQPNLSEQTQSNWGGPVNIIVSMLAIGNSEAVIHQTIYDHTTPQSPYPITLPAALPLASGELALLLDETAPVERHSLLIIDQDFQVQRLRLPAVDGSLRGIAGSSINGLSALYVDWEDDLYTWGQMQRSGVDAEFFEFQLQGTILNAASVSAISLSGERVALATEDSVVVESLNGESVAVDLPSDFQPLAIGVSDMDKRIVVVSSDEILCLQKVGGRLSILSRTPVR